MSDIESADSSQEETKKTPEPAPLRRSVRLANSGWKEKVKEVMKSVRGKTSSALSSNQKTNDSSDSSDESDFDESDREVSRKASVALSKRRPSRASRPS
jgi:hypothetical protein